MANTRREVVGYQPFRTRPLLAEGLLPVEREGGEIQQRVANAFFRLADEAGARADRQAARAGQLAGEQAGLAGRLQTQVSGGDAAISGGAKELTGTRKEKASQAKAYLMQKHGISNVAASAIVGGLAQESAFDTNAINPGDGADGSHSVGLAQWNGKRARALRQFAQSAGKPVNDFETQLDFLVHELGTSEKRAGAQLKAARTIEDAAAAFAGYERPRGWTPQNPSGAHGFANRLGVARSILGVGGDGTATASTDPAGASSPAAPGPVTISSSGGTFRPSGRDTIYGRAFDEAGTKTYLQTLDSEMRSTVSQAFDKYRDDPAGLEKALGDLKTVTARDHVFPEIMADFDVGFDNLSNRYLEQARENLARKVEAQDRAGFIEQAASLETDQQKRLAAFDPASPDAADAIAASQAAIDEHYDAAVDRGILDPDDAARAKLNSRREAALGFYGKQADTLDADGVAAMRKNMEADFADGGIDGLDGASWSTLSKSLAALEDRKRSAEARAEKDFRTEGDRMAARIAAGVEVNPADMAKYAMAASDTPGGKEALRETYAKISVGRAIRDMSLPDARAHVEGLRKQYGKQLTDGELRTLIFAENSYEAKRKAIVSDSVTYGEQQGIARATPLLVEAENTAEMAQIMEQRTKAAADVSEQLGVPQRFLKAGEAAAVAKAVRADPTNGAQIAGAIVAGAGNDAPAVLAEFGDDAPLVAEAGAIIAGGGSNRAAEDVILGYGKGADGKQLKGLKPDAARESYDKVVSNALTLQPKDSDRIARAAAAIARKRISEEGIDPTSDEALDIHARATQEAAGAVFDRGRQYGGFADIGAGLFSSGKHVWVPSNIAVDKFQDVLFSITDADLDALPVKPKAGTDVYFGAAALGLTRERSKAATLRGATPVAVKGGYAFAYGDPASDDPQFVQGDDGKVFILDLEAMRPKLETRVPGAFR